MYSFFQVKIKEEEEEEEEEGRRKKEEGRRKKNWQKNATQSLQALYYIFSYKKIEVFSSRFVVKRVVL